MSSQALQRGLGMDNPDPFAEVILQEAVIKEHGAAILLNDLVTIAIQEGGDRPLLLLSSGVMTHGPLVVPAFQRSQFRIYQMRFQYLYI